jgi:hypothetical protein
MAGSFDEVNANGRIPRLSQAPVPRTSGPAANGRKLPAAVAASAERSTRVGRVLLFVTIGALPFQEYLPTVGGFSFAWFFFAAIGAYIGFTQVRRFLRFAIQPAFLWAAAFLGAAAVLEWSHEYPSFVEIRSIAQMFLGAVLIGTLVRDGRALRTCVYGCLVTAWLFSVLMAADFYSPLAKERASNVSEASAARTRVAEAAPLGANLNHIGYVCGLGSVLSFVTALRSPRRRTQYLWYGLAGFSFVGSSLTLSRSGLLITAALYGLVFFKERLYKQKRVLLVSVLCAIVLGLTPNVAFKRIGVETAETSTRDEGRVVVFKATLHHLPECLISGVGVGGFWGRWGMLSDFGTGRGVVGSHNVFAQVTFYWGVFVLLLLLVTFFQIGRPLLRADGNKDATLALTVIGVGSILLMMFMHNLYAKEFSIAIGVISGWGWWMRRPAPSGRRV